MKYIRLSIFIWLAATFIEGYRVISGASFIDFAIDFQLYAGLAIITMGCTTSFLGLLGCHMSEIKPVSE